MEALLEFLLEVVILVIFIYPGAFIRWLITGFRKPISVYIKGDPYINGVIGLVSIGTIVLLIMKIC